jgi:hypothetical protein
MSDWVIDNSEDLKKSNQKINNFNDWVIDNEQESSFQNESFGQALKNVPGRIASDISGVIKSGINAIPGYYEKSKTEIPALLNPFSKMNRDPSHKSFQGLAGINEAINSIAQIPLDISKYGSNRLNLSPKSITNLLEKITPEDTTQSINRLFGEPKYEGEALFRGGFRNIPTVYPAGKLASIVKPLSIASTKKSIKNSILKQHDELENKANKAFKDVSEQVNNRGINQISIDEMPEIDFELIKSYLPNTRQYKKLITGAEYGDYTSLRKLQSDLYTKGKKNLGSDLEADRIKGSEMLEKRDDINNTIQNHLNKTGNEDLAEKLNGARKDWRILQQTYYNENMNNSLIKLFDKNFRKVPNNLIDLLSEESIPMSNLLDFHPGLESKIKGYKRGQNIFGKSIKYGIPAGAAYLGYEYGKPNG